MRNLETRFGRTLLELGVERRVDGHVRVKVGLSGAEHVSVHVRQRELLFDKQRQTSAKQIVPALIYTTKEQQRQRERETSAYFVRTFTLAYMLHTLMSVIALRSKLTAPVVSTRTRMPLDMSTCSR